MSKSTTPHDVSQAAIDALIDLEGGDGASAPASLTVEQKLRCIALMAVTQSFPGTFGAIDNEGVLARAKIWESYLRDGASGSVAPAGVSSEAIEG